MVLGILEGEKSIILHLPKEQFMGGETVSGKVELRLNEPKKAQSLRLRFKGTYTTGGRHRRTITVFQYETNLDGEKEYPAGSRTYDFSFQLPPKPPEPPSDAVSSILRFFSPSELDKLRRCRWNFDISLVMPLAFDVLKIKEVSVIY